MTKIIGISVCFMLGLAISLGLVLATRQLFLSQLRQNTPTASSTTSPTATATPASPTMLPTQLATPLPPTPPFTLQPPAASLTGSVTAITGDPKREPRDTTDLVSLPTGNQVVEGEIIVTDATSSAQISFTTTNLDLAANTTLVLSDLQPAHFTLTHRTGVLKYSHQSNQPLNVRISTALVELTAGQGTLTYDSENRLLTINLNSGTATLAYIDPSNETQIEKITAPTELTFNTATKKITTK